MPQPAVTPALILSPAHDDVAVALRDLPAEAIIALEGRPPVRLRDDIPAKHKFTLRDLSLGATLTMYGVTVGKATTPLSKGTLVTTDNVVHAAAKPPEPGIASAYVWEAPSLPPELPTTFRGYHRANGDVGTANYWLVVPLVFCENRNVEVLREALEGPLGFRQNSARFDLSAIVEAQRSGQHPDAIAAAEIPDAQDADRGQPSRSALFPHVDGLRFLTHEAGCGGTRADGDRLVDLLAGYLAHPNVAGATILSLGCQNAQVADLLDALTQRGEPPHLTTVAPGVRTGHYLADRHLVLAEQQRATAGESAFLTDTIRYTCAGIARANHARRREAPVSALSLGLECGGSDGFSGITANPLLGRVSDWLVGAGGRSILAEFPELNGVEAELMRRCTDPADARRFRSLMRDYAAAAARVGSGFADNPSPGNIREGLITDAMKSAGAARKAGMAPISGVHAYAEPISRPGLHLLCTPGNDVESTTGLAGSGATLIAFTTGLGTPTGNPVAPTIKLASNSRLAREQPDLIDFDAGTLVSAGEPPATAAVRLWQLLIDIASGHTTPRAVANAQHDFIPWRRDLSL